MGQAVSIDGSIGCGKTSVLNELKAHGYAIDLEPVDAWGPLLVELYAGRLSAFEFQTRAFADRCGASLSIDPKGVTFVERSPLFQERVFVEANAPNMTQEELQTLKKMYAERTAWKPALYVYLRATPTVCAERIAKRARPGEDGISESYLTSLHALHERAYEEAVANGLPIVVFNVNELTVKEIAHNIHILCSNRLCA